MDEKVGLLDAISETGLKRSGVGSFVGPKWSPQMAKMEELVQKFHPKPGVIYSASEEENRAAPLPRRTKTGFVDVR